MTKMKATLYAERDGRRQRIAVHEDETQAAIFKTARETVRLAEKLFTKHEQQILSGEKINGAWPEGHDAILLFEDGTKFMLDDAWQNLKPTTLPDKHRATMLKAGFREMTEDDYRGYVGADVDSLMLDCGNVTMIYANGNLYMDVYSEDEDELCYINFKIPEAQ